MPEPQASETDLRGLPFVRPPDPAQLAAERRWLDALAQQPPARRVWAHLRRGGPAYLQSALTLGGGTASTCLMAGATFGYALLWVAPVAMLLGTVVLAAVAHQTLSTGQRPFAAMRRHAGGFFAWSFGIGALLTSVVWHFAQYALASALLVDLAHTLGLQVGRGTAGLLVLAWAVPTAQMFASGSRWARRFDRLLQMLVWGIVLCFGAVVVATGIGDPQALLAGFVPQVPADRAGVSGHAVVLAGLAAAVVVNMLFLYPYTLLARGWGREHRERANVDLIAGLFVPYVLATSLIVIATANTVYAQGIAAGQKLGPVEAAGIFEQLLGSRSARIVFDVGILAMVLTTITMHMVAAGFALGEMLGLRYGGFGHRLAVLAPTPGFLGAFAWGKLSVWVAVPTSIAGAVLLPIVYLGFWKLQRSEEYLGVDRPRGLAGTIWSLALLLATLLVAAFLVTFLWTEGAAFLGKLFPDWK